MLFSMLLSYGFSTTGTERSKVRAPSAFCAEMMIDALGAGPIASMEREPSQQIPSHLQKKRGTLQVTNMGSAGKTTCLVLLGFVILFSGMPSTWPIVMSCFRECTCFREHEVYNYNTTTSFATRLELLSPMSPCLPALSSPRYWSPTVQVRGFSWMMSWVLSHHLHPYLRCSEHMPELRKNFLKEKSYYWYRRTARAVEGEVS